MVSAVIGGNPVGKIIQGINRGQSRTDTLIGDLYLFFNLEFAYINSSSSK